MPIHMRDVDLTPDLKGFTSILIVPCNLCPGVTVSVREGRPFMQVLRAPFRSAPFEEYLEELQGRLAEEGIRSEVFGSRMYHHWFMCMWTARRRRELEEKAKGFDAVIVLGCDSARETVLQALEALGLPVLEGMRVAGVMNAKLRFGFPDKIWFEECRVHPFHQVPDHDDRQA